MNLLNVPIFCGSESKSDVVYEHDKVVVERIVSESIQTTSSNRARVNADQWHLILQGELTITLNGITHLLGAGDSLEMKKGNRYILESCSGNPPTIRLVIYLKEDNDNSQAKH